jgi:peptidoglycan-associated lipoprotein
MMKKNIILVGMFIVVVFALTIFTGCAEKKAVVTEGTAQEQAAPAQSAATTKEQSAKVEPAATAATVETAETAVKDIFFEFDKFNISPDAREILKANADFLLKNGNSKVVIEGHCDERGTAEYNMALGQRRAQETKKYLVNLGIKEPRIKTISYGEERPFDPGHNEDAWSKNRRAHFAVTP